MKTSSKNALILVLVLLVPAFSQTATFRATVQAGKIHRTDTPVFIEKELPKQLVDGSATAVCAGKTDPAQIEILDNGKARIWWIVADLPANQSQTYTIKVTSAKPSTDSNVFNWTDSSKDKDKSLDLLFGRRPVLRYMYTPFNKSDIERTKKIYHQVFDPNGSQLITKGTGGLFPHHREIFFGYRFTKVNGQSYDTWHCGGGEHQLHKEVISDITGPVMGGHVLKIHWNDPQSKPFIEETRKLIVYRQSEDHLLIDFTSTLQPTAGPVSLSGDRQHAGVQFRASQAVAENEKATRFLRPAKWANLPADTQVNTPEHKDLPWNAIQYKIGKRAYTVAYLSDPTNPHGAEFSERLYGRFGEYFPWKLRKDNPLTVHYRWWISATGSVTRNQIEQRYADMADPPKVVLE